MIYRHGARLDAADKQWHLNSPTPYDPPLTYGGWTQSRALGTRIANLLQSREAAGQATADANRPKRRHRIVIHSSPFLRCVQTSVAIASGISQNPVHGHSPQPISSQSLTTSTLHSSPRVSTGSKVDSPRLEPIPEPTASKPINKDAAVARTATLRVDAFLGEWLSPDYFEHITPPPSSVMMVAGAKSDLLRREDYSHLGHGRETTPTSGFPGGWGSPVIPPVAGLDDGPLSPLSTLAPVPRRDRTSSMSSVNSSTSRIGGRTVAKAANNGENGTYVAPVPHYAVSTSDPIPSGYVSHSKDACVEVDYQWDSMREPQNWGNGGEYGEEWSSMHKRFRKGLTKLVHWYRDNDDSIKRSSRPSTSHGPANNSTETESDDDTDLVIILVTHGAGCNALIGAMTNQPVLLDVGMASLTMALIKPTPQNTPASTPRATPSHSRASSRTVTLSDEYDVKLIASTDHLRRSSTASPSGSRTPSLGALPYRPATWFNANGPGSNPFVEPITIGEPVRSIPQSGNFGSIRRAASVATSGLHRSYTPVVRGSIGLWTAPKPADEETVEEGGEGDDMVLNFGDEDTPSPPSPVEQRTDARPERKLSSAKDEAEDEVSPLSGGLWGNPLLPAEAGAVPERDHGLKRRWTVSEKSL